MEVNNSMMMVVITLAVTHLVVVVVNNMMMMMVVMEVSLLVCADHLYLFNCVVGNFGCIVISTKPQELSIMA